MSNFTDFIGGSGGGGVDWSKFTPVTVHYSYAPLFEVEGTNYYKNSSNFPEFASYVGAYLNFGDQSVTNYTEILNISGASGTLGHIFPPASANNNNAQFIEVTIDGETKEFELRSYQSSPAVLLVGVEPKLHLNQDVDLNTLYFNSSINYGINVNSFNLPRLTSASSRQGVRFNESIVVRFKQPVGTIGSNHYGKGVVVYELD